MFDMSPFATDLRSDRLLGHCKAIVLVPGDLHALLCAVVKGNVIPGSLRVAARDKQVIGVIDCIDTWDALVEFFGVLAVQSHSSVQN